MERLVRYWVSRRDGTVMSDQFAAGYRAGLAAGRRQGREEAHSGRVSQTAERQVAGHRKAS